MNLIEFAARLALMSNEDGIDKKSSQSLAEAAGVIRDLAGAIAAIYSIANDPAFESDAMGWIASECRKVNPLQKGQ